MIGEHERHVNGCGASHACWIDEAGTEWHLGSSHGVYIRFRGEEAIHFLHSGDNRGDGHPETTGVVVDIHDLLTMVQTMEALRR